MSGDVRPGPASGGRGHSIASDGDDALFARRVRRVRDRLHELALDALLLSVGPDLPYLTGYEAMPLERLTMLVLPRDADAVLVVPELEAPRVLERPEVFTMVPWGETADPVELVASAVGRTESVAIGDRTWARFLVELSERLPGTRFVRSAEVTGPLRARKEPAEVEALAAAAAAADRVAAALQSGEVELRGRTEAQVSAELGRRLLAEGHRRVNFAIVAAGENAASPHHEPGERRIRDGDLVLCDFGGTMAGPGGVGYCSDITRCVAVGEVVAEVRDAYCSLRHAQEGAVRAATVGATCESIDGAARSALASDGWAQFFIHRTGHGIGIEEHEDPYIVGGNGAPLAEGHAFSVEPGIYVPDRWGMRLEDIVVASETGPRPLNAADHGLATV